MAYVFKGPGAQAALSEAKHANARVTLESQGVELPTIPAASFPGGVHPSNVHELGQMVPASSGRSRIGCASLPDVQLFFDQKLYKEPPGQVVLPAMQRLGTQTQRLKKAPSIEHRHQWGVKETGQFAQAEVAHKEQLVDNLVGITIGKAALRQTPASRLKHVLRPGFAEHGARIVAMAKEADKADERAYLYYRSLRAEETRQKMRAIRERNKQVTRRQPVVRGEAERAERRANREFDAQWRASLAESAMDVEYSLEQFERTKVATYASAPRREPKARRVRPAPVVEEKEALEVGDGTMMQAQARELHERVEEEKAAARERRRSREEVAKAREAQKDAEAREKARERRRQGEARLHHADWLQQTGRIHQGRRAAKAARAERDRLAAYEAARRAAAASPLPRQPQRVEMKEEEKEGKEPAAVESLPPAAAAEVAAAREEAMKAAGLQLEMEVEMGPPSMSVLTFA